MVLLGMRTQMLYVVDPGTHLAREEWARHKTGTEMQYLLKKLDLIVPKHILQWVIIIITKTCLLYTSDAADERSSVDLGGRRIIKKKTSSTLER